MTFIVYERLKHTLILMPYMKILFNTFARTNLFRKTWKGQSGENIEIIEFGHWNTDGGPDFFQCKDFCTYLGWK